MYVIWDENNKHSRPSYCLFLFLTFVTNIRCMDMVHDQFVKVYFYFRGFIDFSAKNWTQAALVNLLQQLCVSGFVNWTEYCLFAVAVVISFKNHHCLQPIFKFKRNWCFISLHLRQKLLKIKIFFCLFVDISASERNSWNTFRSVHCW